MAEMAHPARLMPDFLPSQNVRLCRPSWKLHDVVARSHDWRSNIELNQSTSSYLYSNESSLPSIMYSKERNPKSYPRKMRPKSWGTRHWWLNSFSSYREPSLVVHADTSLAGCIFRKGIHCSMCQQWLSEWPRCQPFWTRSCDFQSVPGLNMIQQFYLILAHGHVVRMLLLHWSLTTGMRHYVQLSDAPTECSDHHSLKTAFTKYTECSTRYSYDSQQWPFIGFVCSPSRAFGCPPLCLYSLGPFKLPFLGLFSLNCLQDYSFIFCDNEHSCYVLFKSLDEAWRW